MSKENLEINDEQVASMVVDAIPKIISFIIVLVAGFLLLMPLELYFETRLQQYIPNKLVVTGILLAVAFGPLSYFEENIEKSISKIIAKIMKRQLDEGKRTALKNMSKKSR